MPQTCLQASHSLVQEGAVIVCMNWIRGSTVLRAAFPTPPPLHESFLPFFSSLRNSAFLWSFTLAVPDFLEENLQSSCKSNIDFLSPKEWAGPHLCLSSLVSQKKVNETCWVCFCSFKTSVFGKLFSMPLHECRIFSKTS